MSQPMVSIEYEGLCWENQDRLRGVWEPEFGDLVLDKKAPLANKLASVTASTFGPILTINWAESHYGWLRTKDELIPLFRTDQLIRMLDNLGYKSHIGGGYKYPGVSLVGDKGFLHTDEGEARHWSGPDLPTALLKAWLEMLP